MWKGQFASLLLFTNLIIKITGKINAFNDKCAVLLFLAKGCSKRIILSKLQTDSSCRIGRSISSTHMCSSALVFYWKNFLKAFSQHLQMLILAVLTSQCLSLKFKYIQKIQSMHVTKNWEEIFPLLWLVFWAWSKLLFWITVDHLWTLYTHVLFARTEMLLASL